jgi:hypothetical protein
MNFYLTRTHVIEALRRTGLKPQNLMISKVPVIPPPVNQWETIADNLSKAGLSWGRVSAIDSEGRTICIADAHRGDEILTACNGIGRISDRSN